MQAELQLELSIKIITNKTKKKMAYISSNGDLTSRKKFTIFSFFRGLLSGIFNFFSLFITSITGNPVEIQRRERLTTRTLHRNRMQGSNVRTFRNLGVAQVSSFTSVRAFFYWIVWNDVWCVAETSYYIEQTMGGVQSHHLFYCLPIHFLFTVDPL